MSMVNDPASLISQKARSYPDVTEGSSCNQTSFKVGGGSFLFIGPGRKGKGYKAMFKLRDSMDLARELASKEPERFEVGKSGWVTARFTTEDPLPSALWKKWLEESYTIAIGVR